MQQEYRGKTYNHDDQRREFSLSVAIERGKREHLRGKGVETTKNEQGRGTERGTQQWQIHPPQRLADGGASVRAAALVFREINRTERRGKKADGVGKHDGKSGCPTEAPWVC